VVGGRGGGGGGSARAATAGLGAGARAGAGAAGPGAPSLMMERRVASVHRSPTGVGPGRGGRECVLPGEDEDFERRSGGGPGQRRQTGQQGGGGGRPRHVCYC
jgi:hypothetical protein